MSWDTLIKDGLVLDLQIAQRESLERVAYHVARLTGVPAEFWGADSTLGRIESGK